MRKSIALMLGEANSKMSGHAALLNYRYLNLCVKAEAVSLLCVTVQYNGNEYDIEQVADVTGPREDQLQVYPKGPELIPYISKAIATVHPEFKQEVVEEENQQDSDGEEADKSLLLTMPEVNKDRRDALMEAVKVLYDETKVELTATFELYTQKVVVELLSASAEEIKEAKDSVEEIKKQHFDLIDGYRKNKETEIEEAYKRYLEQKEQKEKSQQEKEASINKQVGQSFKMPEMPKAEMPKAEMPNVEVPKAEVPNVEVPKS